MSDIVDRLRWWGAKKRAPKNMPTLPADCAEAADEIERLEKERDYSVRWANKAVEDVKASYEAELANARNAALEEARKVVRNTVLKLSQSERANGDILDDAIYRAIRALKAEGESR